MTIDYDWLERKLKCAVSQTVARGLKWNRHRYGITLKNNTWVLAANSHISGIYPLGIFILDQYTRYYCEMDDIVNELQIRGSLPGCICSAMFEKNDSPHSAVYPGLGFDVEHKAVYDIGVRVGKIAREAGIVP